MSTESAPSVEFHYALRPLHLVEEFSQPVVNEDAEPVFVLELAAASGTGAHAQNTLAKAAGRLRALAEAHRTPLSPIDALMDLIGYIADFPWRNHLSM